MAQMETKITRRLIAAAILVFSMSGCGAYYIVQDTKFSQDGEFRADYGVHYMGALQHDIWAITIAKTHPRWSDGILRKKSTDICTLQGRGELTMTWFDARHLEVACSECDRDAFLPATDNWESVLITFTYNGRPVPHNTF